MPLIGSMFMRLRKLSGLPSLADVAESRIKRL